MGPGGANIHHVATSKYKYVAIHCQKSSTYNMFIIQGEEEEEEDKE